MLALALAPHKKNEIAIQPVALDHLASLSLFL